MLEVWARNVEPKLRPMDSRQILSWLGPFLLSRYVKEWSSCLMTRKHLLDLSSPSACSQHFWLMIEPFTSNFAGTANFCARKVPACVANKLQRFDEAAISFRRWSSTLVTTFVPQIKAESLHHRLFIQLFGPLEQFLQEKRRSRWDSMSRSFYNYCPPSSSHS